MKIAYDTELMRPGCVLLAVALGADSAASKEFDSRDWLTAPTPGLKVYEATPAQIKQLVKMTESRSNR